MVYGYNGKILRVNLDSGIVSPDTLDETFCRRYLGGAGFSTYYLTSELKPHTDPFSPDNILTMMAGPLTGLPLSGSGRHSIGTKSPLTGGYAKSEVGGFWAAELRHAGFDGIILKGKAASPVYLWIHDGEAEIRDAGHLWGQPTRETEAMIRTDLNDNRIRVVSIGPGGENLVRFACIISELKGAAGRGGTGAVMGSKNLKAIAVRGSGGPQIQDRQRLREFRKWLTDNRKLWANSAEYGTGTAMESYVNIGNTPIRNFRDGEFPGIDKISAVAVKNTVSVGMEGCYGCVVRCKKMVKIDDASYQVDPVYGGPEYETLAALGNNCGVSDLKAICKGNELCNAYSLDTISTGLAISFAMECYQNGLLTNKDTGGIDLRFGNTQAMLQAIELIARREGIGNILADGAKLAAEKIGQGAEKFTMQVKGLEFGMHDPRCKAALGLAYATNPNGADHCLSLQDTNFTREGRALDSLHPFGILEPLAADDLSPKKVDMFHYVHSSRILMDSLVVCSRPPFNLEQYTEILKSVTGWDTGTVELLRTADRILTLARLFNIREGFSANDDRLPERMFEGRIGGPAAAKRQNREKLERAKSYYYSLIGWDSKTGIPKPETLIALDIAPVMKQ